jgi:hypothetical protein
MRLASLLLTAIVLTGCGFEEPPPGTSQPAPNPSLPAVPPAAGVTDPCTAFALSLLDGQLEELPSASPEEAEKGANVADEFQARYDEVIAASGVEAARERYAGDIAAACAE